MRPFTSRLVLCAPLIGCLLVGWSGATAAAQIGPPTPATPAVPTITLPGGVLSPTPLAPGGAPRATTGPTVTRGNLEATQTAAIATIAAADATATARAAQPQTAVAGTATLLAQPTATPRASLTPIPTVTRNVTSTPLASVTSAVTPTVATPIATATTPAEGTTTLAAPLNAVLPQDGSIGDQSYPAGTTLVLPAGTVVQGRPDAGATVELRPGTVVQVAGQMTTLVEPLAVVVGSTPVAQPATLPRTGDAAPVLWPIGLGLLLVALGWRLRRAT
jgi:hypothetical protein